MPAKKRTASKKKVIKKVLRKKSLAVNSPSQKPVKSKSSKSKGVNIPPELKLPKVGTKAPTFSLPDQFGATESLEHMRGKWVLIYFYPKDDTPGCTKEACMIRDTFPLFEKLDITVLGVSVDSAKSHAKFAEKYQLPFTLLSDENKTMVNAYGVWGKKKFMGREYMGTNRISFLVNPDGVIAKVYPKVNPALHADEVLNDFKQLM